MARHQHPHRHQHPLVFLLLILLAPLSHGTTTAPTQGPTTSPTRFPTSPTTNPSVAPTTPTTAPSIAPSQRPTLTPTQTPTTPSQAPTRSPTNFPTTVPSITPTKIPTVSPSARPTLMPTQAPTAPTKVPTVAPSARPTLSPTQTPTTPSQTPTRTPTTIPTKIPSTIPTRSPTYVPTTPTTTPTKAPTLVPTAPTRQPTTPTKAPSKTPTAVPTTSPSAAPTLSPTESAWPPMFDQPFIFQTDPQRLNITFIRHDDEGTSGADEGYYVLMESSGVPNHAVGTFSNVQQHQEAAAAASSSGRKKGRRLLSSTTTGAVQRQHWLYEIPLSPRPDRTKPYQDERQVGTLPVDSPIGFAINGVPFFSALSQDGLDLLQPPPGAAAVPALQLDACMGSLSSGGAYNYRAMPPCLFGLNRYRFDQIFTRANVLHAYSPLVLGAPSPIIGYALDGNAIYGPYDADGQLHSGLDNCNGKFLDDEDGATYAYFATPTFPYLMGCFGPGFPPRPPTSAQGLILQDQADQEEDGPALPFEGEEGARAWEEEEDVQQVLLLDEDATPAEAASCPAGSFHSTRILGGCELCPAGRYGFTSGLSSATCSGECPKGHFCPAGSSSPSKCPAGRYGAGRGLETPDCSGPCDAGYFCAAGSTNARQAPCGHASYYCPSGSATRVPVTRSYYSTPLLLSATPRDTTDARAYRTGQHLCDPGFWCESGIRSPCPASRYGGVPGLTSSECEGTCPEGHYCSEQTITPIPCPPGTYGNTTGLVECTPCPPGSICLQASVQPQPSPQGHFAPQGGLSTPVLCPVGYYCPRETRDPLPCAGPAWFCPEGSAKPTPVSAGHYTIGSVSRPGSAQSVDDALTRAAQWPCEPGHWCSSDGVRHACSPGTYGRSSGLDLSTCSGPCQAGWWCPSQSTSATQVQCGSPDVYCPPGSALPLPVQSGFYSTGGGPSTRTGQALCPVGSYCKGGVKRPVCLLSNDTGLSSDSTCYHAYVISAGF